MVAMSIGHDTLEMEDESNGNTSVWIRRLNHQPFWSATKMIMSFS